MSGRALPGRDRSALTENKPISEIFHAFCFVGGRGEGRKVRGREEEGEPGGGAALSGRAGGWLLRSCPLVLLEGQTLASAQVLLQQDVLCSN